MASVLQLPFTRHHSSTLGPLGESSVTTPLGFVLHIRRHAGDRVPSNTRAVNTTTTPTRQDGPTLLPPSVRPLRTPPPRSPASHHLSLTPGQGTCPGGYWHCSRLYEHSAWYFLVRSWTLLWAVSVTLPHPSHLSRQLCPLLCCFH